MRWGRRARMAGKGSEAAELGSDGDPAAAPRLLAVRVNSNPPPWMVKTEALSSSPIDTFAHSR